MGRLLLLSLPATGAIIYRCKHCDTHLAYDTDIIARTFRCKNGKAYLFNRIVNVNVGSKDDRMMTTGLHTVCDIFCVACGAILGWKYLVAFDKSQRYKEGKFILDRSTALAARGGGPDDAHAHAHAHRGHNHHARVTSSADDDDPSDDEDDQHM